jgi:hypothetical protein
MTDKFFPIKTKTACQLKWAWSLMPQTNWQKNMAFQYLTGIHQQIQNSCKNSKLIVQLVTHLGELNQRRGTHWRLLFPYIEEEYNYVV